MNFGFVGIPYYDYLQATVVQGLQKLGHRCLGFGQDTRNYMEPYYPGMPLDVFVFVPQDVYMGDANLTGQYAGIPKILLWVHDRVLPDRINDFKPNNFKFDVAFVRELTQPYPNVHPINFGIEDRFYQFTDNSIRGMGLRPTDIIFQGNTEGAYPHVKKRREFIDRLKEDFGDYNLDIGHTKTKDPDITYSQVVTGRHQHYSDYFFALSRSKIALCLHGAGEDCARTWEAFASGAVPAIQRYTIRHVEPWWKDGVNCIEFDTYEEFRHKVDYHLTVGKNRLLDMQKRAWAFGRQYHRTQHRAQYILDIINEVLRRNNGKV